LRVDPASVWDWLALVRIDLETGVRDIYVLPRQTVLALSGGPDALGAGTAYLAAATRGLNPTGVTSG
jgi:hypothetical protein